MENLKYHYSAKVKSVHDGDTITCDIDLGFGITLNNQKFRFFGINAPELHGDNEEAGKASQVYVSERILDKEIVRIANN
jgi:micrococcal nuclease